MNQEATNQKPNTDKSNAQDTHAQALAEHDPLADFNLDSLRVSQDFNGTIGVKKLQLTIPVGKPGKQEFFRANPDPTHRLTTAALALDEDRETYLVTPEVAALLPGDAKLVNLVTVVTRQQVVRIWPLRLPGPDGRVDNWMRSSAEAAKRAESAWIKIVANMSAGAYDVYVAQATIDEPTWPDMTFAELVARAFQGRIIDSIDHPVVRRLQGLV